MNQINKRAIEEAVKSVYSRTDCLGCVMAEVKCEHYKIGYLGYVEKDVFTISRSIKEGDLTYKLYTTHDTKPLMTVFGCWPPKFVTDVFIRALEHFYNDYS